MLSRILSVFGYEKRSVDFDPRFSADVWGKAVSAAGYVSAGSVLSSSSVAYRAIDLKATLLASTPLKVFHRLSEGGRQRAINIPLARMLDRPNAYMTRYEFVELLSRSLDLTGNFFARVEYARTGEVAALHPINSYRVQVERTPSGAIRYRVSAATHEPARVLLDGEMLHVKGHSPDGLVGQSPLTIAREALGLGLRLDKAARESAGKQIGGFMVQPTVANAPQKRRQQEAINEKLDGDRSARGRYDVKVLDIGSKFVPTTFSNADTELLESRKLSDEAVCRIFGVPPASVGISTSVSYGSAAQSSQDLITNTLNPLAVRIESAIERALLSDETRRNLFVEFDLSGLLRADPSERWRTYEVGRRINALAPNEIRAFENLPPYIGGDTFDAPKSQAPAQAEQPIASVKP